MNDLQSNSEETNTPLISVIIPVYNEVKYLDRAVQSVLRQSYSNLEIILIDDGSDDGSKEKCDGYANCDDRVLVIHQSNSGQSSARNAGLERVTGKLVAFLDSDDWLEPDTFEYCISLLHVKDADIVQFDTMLTDGAKKEKNRKQKVTLLQGKECLNYLMVKTTKSDCYYAVWNCLYKREILNGYRFAVGKTNEDIVWKYQVVRNANSMLVSTAVKYFYFKNSGSLTKSGLKKRDFDLIQAGREIKELSEQETYGKIAELGRVKCARSSLSLLCRIAYYGILEESINKKVLVKEFKRDLRKHYFLLIASPMAFSRKILASMFCISYTMTEFAVQCVKKITSTRSGKCLNF